RRLTLALYFVVMFFSISIGFGYVFYLASNALPWFLAMLFVLGLGGANFAMYTLWLPEQYTTDCRERVRVRHVGRALRRCGNHLPRRHGRAAVSHDRHAGRIHVDRVSDRTPAAAVRRRNQGQAAPRLTRSSAISYAVRSMFRVHHHARHHHHGHRPA